MEFKIKSIKLSTSSPQFLDYLVFEMDYLKGTWIVPKITKRRAIHSPFDLPPVTSAKCMHSAAGFLKLILILKYVSI